MEKKSEKVTMETKAEDKPDAKGEDHVPQDEVMEIKNQQESSGSNQSEPKRKVEFNDTIATVEDSEDPLDIEDSPNMAPSDSPASPDPEMDNE